MLNYIKKDIFTPAWGADSKGNCDGCENGDFRKDAERRGIRVIITFFALSFLRAVMVEDLIGDVVNLINDIAAQTNLLARNTTIFRGVRQFPEVSRRPSPEGYLDHP